VNRLIQRGQISPEAMRLNHVHSVSDDRLMNMLGIVTKMTISRTLLLQLRDAGREAMSEFLDKHRSKLGQRSSVDLKAVVSSAGSIV
jgi:NTE family protein